MATIPSVCDFDGWTIVVVDDVVALSPVEAAWPLSVMFCFNADCSRGAHESYECDDGLGYLVHLSEFTFLQYC